MDFLTKEAILAAQDLKHEVVEVPEWGGQVGVRMMTGTERDAFEDEVFKMRGKNVEQNLKNFRSRLLVRTLTDGEGNRLFNDNEISVLGGKSAPVLDRLFTVSQKLNGIGPKDVEEATKNSGGDLEDSSASGSPES